MQRVLISSNIGEHHIPRTSQSHAKNIVPSPGEHKNFLSCGNATFGCLMSHDTRRSTQMKTSRGQKVAAKTGFLAVLFGEFIFLMCDLQLGHQNFCFLAHFSERSTEQFDAPSAFVNACDAAGHGTKCLLLCTTVQSARECCMKGAHMSSIVCLLSNKRAKCLAKLAQSRIVG